MVMGEGLFRTFHKENRFLSDYLTQRFEPRLRSAIDTCSLADLQGDSEELAKKLVAAVRVPGPRLGGAQRASMRPNEGVRRPTTASSWVGTNRHYVAYQLVGDHAMLDYWPDQEGSELEPIDADCANPPYTSAVPTFEELVARMRFETASNLWTVNLRTGEQTIALFTFADLTPEEEVAVQNGSLDIRARFDDLRAKVEPIVDAIRLQAEAYFDGDLALRTTQYIEQRAGSLSASAAVSAALEWPNGWEFSPPELESVPIAPTKGAVSKFASTEVEIPQEPRLQPASFERVLRIARVWADSVERTPVAFNILGEDQLSDILCATFNATLPGANREVYSRGGKSDIFVRADVLNEGYGPAKIFVCESKIWGGKAQVLTEIGQLFGYLETRDTAAALIYFNRNLGNAGPRADALAELRGHHGFEADLPEVVSGWPMLRFNLEDRKVTLALIFVDVPPRVVSGDDAGGGACTNSDPSLQQESS